jgi:hypothetical protein
LLAARVLAEYFQQVTLMEKDVPGTHRKRVGVFRRAGTHTCCWRVESRYLRGCFPDSLRIW